MFARSTTTHGTLLARVADPNDADAWKDFCGQYEEMIRSFARRQGVLGSSADDIVQEVLLSLTRAMPGFEYQPSKGKFRSYLKTVVIHAIIRKRQKESGEAAMGDVEELSRAAASDESLDAVWEEEWRQQHLRRAMRILDSEFNAADLACFRAYVMNGEDPDDVANRAGMTTAQIYRVKSRMLRRLRELIAAQVEDEG